MDNYWLLMPPLGYCCYAEKDSTFSNSLKNEYLDHLSKEETLRYINKLQVLSTCYPYTAPTAVFATYAMQLFESFQKQWAISVATSVPELWLFDSERSRGLNVKSVRKGKKCFWGSIQVYNELQTCIHLSLNAGITLMDCVKGHLHYVDWNVEF